MVRILAVNNYPDTVRFQKLKRCISENGAEVATSGWRTATARRFGEFDGVVLSGSPDMMSKAGTRAKFGDEMDAIRDSHVPVLGVCFGHQMVACAFGGEVVEDARHVLGFVETTVLSEDLLFSGLPKKMMLLESRHEVVPTLPKGFSRLASSSTSAIAAMKHERRPLYGVQFHPERHTAANPQGDAVVRNFVRLSR